METLISFLSLICLTICIPRNEAIKTYLFDCQDRGKVLHYKTDVVMELCCTTDYEECVSNQTLLTIREDGGGIKFGANWTLSHYGNTSSVKLMIPSSQESYSGMYGCYCHDSRVYRREIHVISKIEPPVIHSFTSTLRGRLTIKFYPGLRDSDIDDTFTVYAQYKTVRTLWCTNDNITCTKRKCKCTNELQENITLRNITFIVVKQRSVQQAVTSKVFNLIDYVKPGPVTKLRVEDLTSTSAILALCAPSHFWLIFPQMDYRKHPLNVLVEVVKTQGVYGQKRFNIIFNQGMSMKCLKVPQLQLVPFTKYNVTVTAAGGGGMGKSTIKTFTTHKAAPLSPPDRVFYWIVKDEPDKKAEGSTEQEFFFPQKNEYSININWKPLTHDEKGGTISYEVFVSYEYKKKNVLFNRNVNESFVILRNIPDTTVFVKIYAKNEIGMSKNCSYLIIQRDSEYHDIIQLESHVETDESNATINIQKTPSGVEISAIYACVGYQHPQLSTQIVCEGSPQMISNGNSFNFGKDRLSAVLSIKKRECLLENMTEMKQKVFRFYKNFSGKTKLWPLSQNYTATYKYSRQNTSCTSISLNKKEFEFSKTSTSFQLKFMFSLKDKLELPRLFPFKCYYDHNLDNVKLIFNQTVNGDRISFAWKQACDSKRPNQFLAKYFHVYTSQDAKCESDRKFTKLENNIMHWSGIGMSLQKGYGCVESFKSTKSIYPPSKASPEELRVNNKVKGEGDGIPSWIIGTITVLVIAGGILSILCMRWMYYRRKKTRLLFDGLRSTTVEFENETFQIHTFPEKKCCHEEDDSGRGSSHDYEKTEDKVEEEKEREILNKLSESNEDLPSIQRLADDSGNHSALSVDNFQTFDSEQNVFDNAAVGVDISNDTSQEGSNVNDGDSLPMEERHRRALMDQGFKPN